MTFQPSVSRPQTPIVVKPDSTATFTSQEFDEAFELAKRALSFVGKFRTPPSPEVYELWYRYVEGKDPLLNERMSFLVNESGRTNRSEIDSLRQEFFHSTDTAEHQHAADELIASMSGLESIIIRHSDAGERFEVSLNHANEKLIVGNPSAEDVKLCVDEVLASNEKMRTQLVQVKIQLAQSHAQMDRLRSNLTNSQLLLMTDALTGVGNRRYFDFLMARAINQPAEDRLSQLLLVDLDNLKKINDTYGHDSGDRVIQFVAGELKKLTEEAELARYGGDEFAIFAHSADHEAGERFAESIIETLSRKSLTLTQTGETIGRIGVSVGAAFLRPGDTSTDWFQRADKLLYAAKSGGRNMSMIERNVG